MAAIVGAEGDVVGVDRDEAILRLAEQEAERRGLSVAFRRLDAEGLTEQSAYDLVFARYLLSHLSRPQRAVEAMVRALRPGGRLVLEDVFFPGHVCYPASAAFARYLELYQYMARAKEGGRRGDRAAPAGVGAGGRAGGGARRAGCAHLPRRRGQAGGASYDGAHTGGGCGHRVGHRGRGGRHRRRAGQVRRRRSDADEHSAYFPGVGPQSRCVRPASGRWALRFWRSGGRRPIPVAVYPASLLALRGPYCSRAAIRPRRGILRPARPPLGPPPEPRPPTCGSEGRGFELRRSPSKFRIGKPKTRKRKAFRHVPTSTP